MISALVGTICIPVSSGSHAANAMVATTGNTIYESIPITQEFAKIPEEQLKLFTCYNLTDSKGTKKDIAVDPYSNSDKAMTALPEHAHDMITPVNKMLPTRFRIYGSATKKELADNTPAVHASVTVEKNIYTNVRRKSVNPAYRDITINQLLNKLENV